MGLPQHAETGFGFDEIAVRNRRFRRIQVHRVLALFDFAGIESEQRPMPAFHGQILLAVIVGQIHAVRDARRISDDNGRAIMGFGFQKRIQGLGIFTCVSDMGDIDIAVIHRQQCQVFFRRGFAACGEFRHCA